MNTIDKKRWQSLIEKALTVGINYMEGEFSEREIVQNILQVCSDYFAPSNAAVIVRPDDTTPDPFELFWDVGDDGTLYNKGFYDYDIEGERLTESDWILHLSGKGWVDLNTFIPAYFKALSKRGIKEITIKTSH